MHKAWGSQVHSLHLTNIYWAFKHCASSAFCHEPCSQREIASTKLCKKPIVIIDWHYEVEVPSSQREFDVQEYGI